MLSVPFLIAIVFSAARLQGLLQEWEKANHNVRAVHYIMEWTIKDRILKDEEVRRVEGFVDGHGLARVDLMDEKGKPAYIIVANGKTLDWYDFQNERKMMCRIPPGFPEDYLDKGWPQWWIAHEYLRLRELLCWEFPVSNL